MAISSPKHRKYRGLARSRIQLQIDSLNRQLRYDTKHPDKPVFDAAGDAAVATVLTQLGNALAAMVIL
jgi:hypothetical protein